MAEVKTGDKSENFSDIFFDVEKLDKNGNVVCAENSNLTVSETEKFFDSKKSYLVNFLKQIFLFLPGNLFLYFISFSTTIAFWDIISRQKPLFSISVSEPLFSLLLLAFSLIGSLMTWFGLGNLKNRKHLVIPVSIIILGAVFGIIFDDPKIGPNRVSGTLYSFRQAVFLFPLVLTAPVLLKRWIDTKDVQVSAES